MAGPALFGKKPSLPPAPAPDAIQVNSRLALVEEKASNLNRKFEVLEKNLLDNVKKFNANFQSFDAELLDMKHEIDSLKQKIDLIIKELKMTAGKDELNTLKKYLDLWNPTRFVTLEQAEKIVEEKLQKNL